MLRIRAAALFTVTALVAVACGPAASPTPGPTPTGPAATATPTAPAIKEGGTLIVGLPGDMVVADPSMISDSNSSYIQINVVEGLLGIKPGTLSDIIPVLAESLPEVSADGLTYTFKLRQGVKFHDGTDFNADAVVTSYLRQRDTPVEIRDAYNYYFGAVFGWAEDSNLKSVEKVDEFTVDFTLGQPQSNFLIAQAPLPIFAIQSPTALEAGDANNPDPSKSCYAQGTCPNSQSMVGTGPFMFKEWVPNDHVTIVKNPNYWDTANAAHLDEVIFKPFADQTAELNALQAGDIDLAQTIDPIDIATLQADPSFQVIDRGESCNVGGLWMNHTHAPLDNKDIRTAIAHALNKQAYIDAFYAGLAVPADNWMPPATQYYKALNLPTYNVQAAKDAIAASGVSGDDLTIELWYPSDVARPYMPNPKALAEAIATDLEAVGFTIELQSAGWRTGYLRDEALGLYPMWLLGWTCDWPSPDNFLVTAFFHFAGEDPNPEFAYGPPDLLAAFNTGLSAADEATTQAAWVQAQDILARDLPDVPIVHSKPPAAASADVKGFLGAGNLNELLYFVWLDR